MHQSGSRRSMKAILRLLIVVLFLNLMSIKAFAYDQSLEEAKYLIKNAYVNEVTESVLSLPTIKDMVNALNDPYSQYLTAEEYRKFVQDINMDFSGIGVYIDIVPEGVRIISVMKGSPAEGAGLQEGDIITSADGHALAGLPSDTAVSYIRGPEGTTVELLVKRDGVTRVYSIVRQHIISPTIRGEMLDSRIGYIEISSFGDDTAQDFRETLAELDKQNPEGFIVDLRNNGGGYLDTAIDLGGNFIGEQTVVLTRDRYNEETTYVSPGSVKVIDKPIILLVNEFSASASEILAGAIKDYGKAFLVGTRTYGKGTVQTLYQLSDSSVLKLTVQKFYSPKGNVIDQAGVLPDFEVTEDIDSLAVAHLLFGSSGSSSDKREFVKVTLGGRQFEIDLKAARLPEYWEAFKYIMEKAASSGFEISAGTREGWVKAADASSDRLFKLLYPEFRETTALNDVPVDKKFTIVFTEGVDQNSINGSSMELVNASTGARVLMNYEFVDERTVKAVPAGGLKSGETYYLVINGGVSSKAGGGLKEGTVTKVKVK